MSSYIQNRKNIFKPYIINMCLDPFESVHICQTVNVIKKNNESSLSKVTLYQISVIQFHLLKRYSLLMDVLDLRELRLKKSYIILYRVVVPDTIHFYCFINYVKIIYIKVLCHFFSYHHNFISLTSMYIYLFINRQYIYIVGKYKI